MSDIKYALRWLRRSPGFAAVAILSLGLGIGANVAMFSLVDAVLLRPLPVHDPGSLADVFTTDAENGEHATSSYPDFLDLKAENQVFSDMTAYTPMFAALNLGDRSRLILGHVVTSNHFSLLGVPARLGRTLQPADDEPGAEPVVVISHRMWQRDFGGDPGVIGRTLQLRGRPYTIVGVAPASFTGAMPLFAAELWLPIIHNEEVDPAGINSTIPSPTGNTRMERRGSRWLFVKGRLRPGVSIAEARANIGLIGRQLAAAHPATNARAAMNVFPTSEVRLLVPQAAGPLTAGSAGVMAVVALVLLIACANVAGMLLARASSRNREIGIRLAVGAGRMHIVRQMLSEGLVLGLSGAIVAVVSAWALIRLLLSIQLPLPAAIVLEVPIDVRMLVFALVVGVGAGLLAALTPALKTASLRLAADLKGEVAAPRVAGRRWAFRDLLVVGQLSLTFVLLVVAGLLLRSLAATLSADVGFRTVGLAMVAADLQMVRYTPERSARFWDDALARIEALPGVEAAAFASPRLPFDVNFSQLSLRIDGRSYAPDSRGDVVSNVSVSSGYFETLDVPIVEGRGFTPADREGAPLVAVVNETMARRFWPGESAVGKTFEFWFRPGQKIEVVGVARDHRVHTVAEQPAPYLHLALAQRPTSYRYLVARTNGNAATLLAAMRRELLALEPGLVFINSGTMDDSLSLTLLPQRVAAALSAGFGGIGTLLAAIGLYGVIAFAVARRTREIGVRMALGADRSQVLGLVMRQGLVLLVLGLGVGAALAAGAAGVLRGVLYGVDRFDPVAWGAALFVLCAASLGANLIPARRAMRVDPVTALRTE